MKKDLFVSIGIWLLSTVLVFFSVSVIYNNFLLKSIKFDASKYITIADTLANMDAYEGISGSNSPTSAMAMRRVLSNSVMEEAQYKIEYAYVFTSSHGDFDLSTGIFSAIMERGEDGKISAIKNNKALFKVEDIYGTEEGEAIYSYITEHEFGGIKADKYAVKNGFAYLLEITFTDENEEAVAHMICNSSRNLDGFEIREPEDEWIYHGTLKNMLDLKEAFDNVGKDNKALFYANNLKNSVEYSGITNIQHSRPRITGGTYSTVTTNGQYAFISVMNLETGTTGFVFGRIAAGIWSFLVVGVSAIIIVIRHKRRNRY